MASGQRFMGGLIETLANAGDIAMGRHPGHWSEETIKAMNAANSKGDQAGMVKLMANEAINPFKALGTALDDRILNNPALKKKFLGENPKEGAMPGVIDKARSLFYNRKGDLQYGRIAGVAGSYIGANEAVRGSSGIPFI